MKPNYIEKLKWEFETSRSKYTENELNIYLKYEYKNIINDARLKTAFGNQFHLLAVSTFLKRNIYIYTLFSKIAEKLSADRLKVLFDEMDPNLGRHVKYIPVENSLFEKRRHNFISLNLYGYHVDAHYTSLIPSYTDPLQFIPKNAWFD